MEWPERDLREAWARLSEGQDRHLPPGALSGYLGGSRDAGVQAHLAACGACRSALVALGRSPEKGSTLTLLLFSGRARWAAAAGLLVAAGVFWKVFSPEAPTRAPSPAVPSSSGSAAEEHVLGAGLKICAAPGAAWSRAGDGALVLEKGSLLLEASGERAILRLPGMVAETSEGILAVEIEAPAISAAWAGLFSEAHAGEARAGRLTVLSGLALVRAEGASVSQELGPGASVRAEGGALIPCSPVAWRGPSWAVPPKAEGVLRDAREILLARPPAGGYVLEVQVRKLSERAALGVLLPAGGRGYLIALGSQGLVRGEGWTLLRVSCGAGRVRVTAGEQVALNLSESALGARLPEEAAEGAGLRAWGGEIAFRGARWRVFP